MSIFKIELRRSPWIFVAVLVSLVWPVLTLGRRNLWSGSWNIVTGFWETYLFLFAVPIVSVVAYSRAVRENSGLDQSQDISALPPWYPWFTRTAALLGTALLPIVTSLTVLAVVQWRQVGSGFFDLPPLAAGVLFFLCLVMVGDTVGVIAVSPRQAVVLGALIGVVLTFFGGADLLAGAELRLSWYSAVFAGIGLGMLLIVNLWVSNRGQLLLPLKKTLRPWFATLGVLGFVLTLVGEQPGSHFVSRPQPMQPACSGEKPKVCVWPDLAFLLPQLLTYAENLERAVGAEIDTPVIYYQQGLREAPRSASESIRVLALDKGLYWTAQTIAGVAYDRNFVEGWCDPATEADLERRDQLHADVLNWMEFRTYEGDQPAEIEGYRADVSAIRPVLLKSNEEQRLWLRETIAQARAIPCVQGQVDE